MEGEGFGLRVFSPGPGDLKLQMYDLGFRVSNKFRGSGCKLELNSKP